jgi:hypothetical protein
LQRSSRAEPPQNPECPQTCAASEVNIALKLGYASVETVLAGFKRRGNYY